jgi:hypothetical protein
MSRKAKASSGEDARVGGQLEADRRFEVKWRSPAPSSKQSTTVPIQRIARPREDVRTVRVARSPKTWRPDRITATGRAAPIGTITRHG